MIVKALKVIFNSRKRFLFLQKYGFFNKMDDEKYLQKLYYSIFGKELRLNNPQTYNEKLQWLKLYNRKKEYTEMVDKARAKEYVSKIIGSDYVIPTIGIYDSFSNIDFSSLPNQFVIKCTHDSGGIVICRDKSSFDQKTAFRKIQKSLKNNYYLQWREWPYKDVPHKIIIEQYMEDQNTRELRDYKFFTFGGKVKLMFIATDRQSTSEETKFDFFDENYNHLNINNGHPNAHSIPQKPENFELMKELAEKLSVGIPHLRVDFYEINGKVYFGELTFFHWSGLVPFEPEEWDEIMGEWIVLPNKEESL